MKIAVVGAGYVGLSNAVLISKSSLLSNLGMRGAGNQEPTPSVQPDPLWHPVLTTLGTAQLVSRPDKDFLSVCFQCFARENQAHQ